MSKIEFLSQLSSLLSDLSAEEREEALTYYKEYIEDAGLENEESILDELGSVEDLAVQIKKGLANKDDAGENYRPFHAPDTRKEQEDSSSEESQHSQTQNSQGQYSQYQQKQYPQTRQSNTGAIILGILAAILLCPIWIPFVCALFGVLLGIIISLICLIIGIGAAGIICAVVGIFLFVLALTILFAEPLPAAALIGASFIVVSIGILFLVLTGWFCATAFPWIINCIGKLFRSLTHRKVPREVSL